MPRTALPSSSLAGGAAEEGQSSRMEGFSTRVSSGDGNDGLNLEEKMTSLEALGFDKNQKSRHECFTITSGQPRCCCKLSDEY